MKALSLTQPWATLVALREKRIETRSWSTSYAGPLAIHAAKAFPGWAKELCEEEPFRSSLAVQSEQLPIGSVVCLVKLIGCRRTEDVRKQLTEKELAYGDYEDGRFAWFLEFDRIFEEPILAKGNRLLWNWIAPWDN